MQIKPFFVASLIAVFALTLSACASQTSTRATSIIDPAYQGVMFNALVVEVESGLQERDIIERRAVAGLNNSGINAQPSLDILPATREYAQATRKRKISATGMQALLVITPADKRMLEEYIPPTYYNPYRGRRAHSNVFGGYGGGYGGGGFGIGMGYGIYEPGMLYREPQADYIASIYTLPNFDRAWTSEFSVTGTNGMDYNDVAGRFADVLIKRLRQDGMIP
jgi:hypothetical protein